MSSSAVITGGAPRWTMDPRAGFRTAAEFLGAVTYHGHGDERLRFLAALGSDEHGTHTSPTGDFLVPPGLASVVLRVPPEQDPTAAVREVDMRFPDVWVPARADKNHSTSVTGGLRVLRTPETVEAVSSRGLLEQINLGSGELIGVAFVTTKLADGAEPHLSQWLQDAFTDALTDTLRTERIRGTGVGEGRGVLNSAALITVAKEVGQGAATVNGDNVVKMAARCWGYDEGANWIANPELRPQLIACADGQGNRLYRFADADGQHDRLAGRPVFYDERASALGSVGDLLLCRWSEYLNGVYTAPGLASSIHVRLVQGENALRFYLRGDSAPWWTSALSPRFGTNTLSPYVTLEARA